MKLVEVKSKHIENGTLTPNEKYTIEHYLKSFIETEFKRMSQKEISDVLNDEMESPANFVVERVSEMMSYCVDYTEDNEEEISFDLETTYYDFCIDYLRKLAVKKYGNKFSSAMKGHRTRVPSKKHCPVRIDFRKML